MQRSSRIARAPSPTRQGSSSPSPSPSPPNPHPGFFQGFTPLAPLCCLFYAIEANRQAKERHRIEREEANNDSAGTETDASLAATPLQFANTKFRVKFLALSRKNLTFQSRQKKTNCCLLFTLLIMLAVSCTPRAVPTSDSASFTLTLPQPYSEP